MWVTEVGIDQPPKTSLWDYSPRHIPPNSQHALLVNFKTLQPLEVDQLDVQPEEHSNPMLVEWLKGIVRQNGEQHPLIDAVHFSRTDPPEWPSLETWGALNGLHPSHVGFTCGSMEGCDLKGLDSLNPRWPLKSIFVSSCTTEMLGRVESVDNIESLSLDYNTGVPFSNSFPSLREITIRQDAIRTFAGLVEHQPKNRWNIQTVKLQEWEARIQLDVLLGALKKCPDLTRLELGVIPRGNNYFSLRGAGHEYTQFLNELPSSLQHLSLAVPSTVEAALPNWLKMAQNPGWLPNLRSIHIRTNTETLMKVHPKPPHLFNDLPAKKVPGLEQFFSELQGRRPSLLVL